MSAISTPTLPAPLRSERLLLRPYRPDDVPVMVEHLNDFEIAKTTLMLPHPYRTSDAEGWLATHEETFRSGRGEVFAIERSADQQLIGGIDIRINAEHACAEIGYLIYRAYWNQGFASEAARRLVHHGFEDLGLARIHAHHFAGNEGSGRVLQRCGMRFEGVLRGHIERWGTRHDLVLYGVLREEFTTSD